MLKSQQAKRQPINHRKSLQPKVNLGLTLYLAHWSLKSQGMISKTYEILKACLFVHNQNTLEASMSNEFDDLKKIEAKDEMTTQTLVLTLSKKSKHH